MQQLTLILILGLPANLRGPKMSYLECNNLLVLGPFLGILLGLKSLAMCWVYLLSCPTVNNLNSVNHVDSVRHVNSVNSFNNVNSVNHTPGPPRVTVILKILLEPGHHRATVN